MTEEERKTHLETLEKFGYTEESFERAMINRLTLLVKVRNLVERDLYGNNVQLLK